MASTRELLERFVTLFNENRLQEAEGDFAPDAQIEEIGTNMKMTPQESTASAQAWREAFPDARGVITSAVVDGDTGAAEIVWRGTNKGPFMGRPATGLPVTVQASVFIETRGGKITRSAHYIDVATMMSQLAQGASA